MAQSKQELAERNANLRAEKLRENLGRRKQQLRQKAIELHVEADNNSGDEAPNNDRSSAG